jgi:TP901 family phage tail tape measure protein
MRKFGLSAILSFVDKGATAAMGRIGRKAKTLQDRFRGIGRGVARMSRGFSSMAIGAAPVTAAFGLMIKKGAQFEQAIANLRAVSLDIKNETTPALESLAKTLGATTVFSATESANAMTALKRAGLDVNQVMKATRGTLSAAAAEGLDLADAAGMVASGIKAFNIPAEQAAAIAGKLALASARTNTNMVGLSEGLKLAAPAVKPLQASLGDTLALLGGLADIGLKGTLGGTAIRSSMAKLLNPTKKGRKAIASLGIAYGDLKKTMDKGDIIGTFKKILGGLKGLPKRSDRAAAAINIFGLRGIGMASALDLSDKAMDRFNETTLLLRKETGKTAEAMAALQLKTLTGQVTLLKSAFEGVSIELFGMISSETSGGVKRMATTLGQLSIAMRLVSGEVFVDPKQVMLLGQLSPTIIQVATGIKEAFGDIKRFVGEVITSLGGLAKWFGIAGDEGAKGQARFATKAIASVGAIAPLSLAVIGLTSLLGGMANVAVGAFKVVANTIAVVAKGAGGVLGFIGKRVPRFGNFLGKFGGLLGKAGKLTDKAIARPVRVVNFEDMALAQAGPSALKNQLPLFGGGKDKAGGATAGLLTRMRGGLAGVVGRLGKFGAFLNKGAFAASSLSGKLGKAGLVGAALGVGYAFGTLIDKTFGLSKRISDFFLEREKDQRKVMNENLTFVQKELHANKLAIRTVKQLTELQRKGIGLQGPGGKKEAITREVVRARLAESLRKQGMTQAQQTVILANMATLLGKIPKAGTVKPPTPVKPAKDAMVSSAGFLPVSAGDVVLDRASLANALTSQQRGAFVDRSIAQAAPAQPAATSGELRIEIPLTIDGRAVALAVANVKLDDLERQGADLGAGQRASLLQRGFAEVT